MIAEHIQPWFVIVVVAVLFFVIYKEYLRASISFMLAVLILSITGILDAHEVLSGFSNESIASVLMLILITTGIRKNFQIELLFDFFFKKARNYRGFLIRMMSQVAILSSFINNTPIVALMTPYVVDWGKKNNISPSKLLIPLSYAAVLGGMVTLIGTSTTLVLNGFIEDFGYPSLKLSDLFITGSIVAVAGILFIGFVGPKLLPNHTDILKSYTENKREFITETRVLAQSRLINKSVIEAGLRKLKGVYLVEILRNDRVISPVGRSEIIQENDILFFAGNTDDIVDLIHTHDGLELPSTARSFNNDKTEIIETVLNNNSSLIGKKVKKSDFRKRYNAAIIAIHRNGKRVRGKIGEIELEAGDVLLLYTGSDFRNRVDLYRDLFVISQLRQINKPGAKKYYALLTIILCAGVLLYFGKFTLFPSLLIILSIMAGFKLIDTQDVKRELDLNMIAILVFSLAIGVAIYKTHAGEIIANGLLSVLEPYGTLSLFIGLVLITNILTTIVGNIGAVSISFPVGLSLCTGMGIDPTPFFLGIAYASSGVYMSPVSYQTNLIIYGPGGYRFIDFLKIGLPVNLLYLSLAITIIIWRYKEILL